MLRGEHCSNAPTVSAPRAEQKRLHGPVVWWSRAKICISIGKSEERTSICLVWALLCIRISESSAVTELYSVLQGTEGC